MPVKPKQPINGIAGPLRGISEREAFYMQHMTKSGGSAAGAGGGWARTLHGSVARRAVVAVASTLLWMGLSSALIIFNKHLYVSGFPFPMAATGMGQVFTALGGGAMAAMGLMPLRRPPPLTFFVLNLGPVILCCAATMFFGNYAYLHLSVAFIQILKAFTPAITLLMCVAARLEAASMPLLTSVLLIALGTGGAVLIESGAPSFSPIGLAAFLASSVTEAGRVVYSQRLLGPQRFNSAEVLVFVSAPSAALLLAASAVWELPAMLASAPAVASVHPAAYLAAFGMSFAVNVSSYWAIAATSSLTFKVAGCLKNIGVAWWGVAAHAERVSVPQAAGYAVSVAGFVLYSIAKSGYLGGGVARGGAKGKAA